MQSDECNTKQLDYFAQKLSETNQLGILIGPESDYLPGVINGLAKGLRKRLSVPVWIIPESRIPNQSTLEYDELVSSFDTVLAFGLRSKIGKTLIFFLDAKNKGVFSVYICRDKDRYTQYADFAVMTSLPGIFSRAIRKAQLKKINNAKK